MSQQPPRPDGPAAFELQSALATTFPCGWGELHGGRLASLVRLGQLAAEVTKRYFRQPLEVEDKADASPVTIADRTAESEFRRQLQQWHADDAILGEEHGDVAGTTGYRWVVDPIDGTKSFIAGVPLYTTLVALEYEGEPLAGGIWAPALGEVAVACQGTGCWYRPTGSQNWEQTHVSSQNSLDRAIFLTTAVDSFEEIGRLKGFESVQRAAWFTRTWGDGYGYLLVATGRAEVMVDPIVSPWDIAGIAPLIWEAGGEFTDWSGARTTKSRNAVATNGVLHQQILQLLS